MTRSPPSRIGCEKSTWVRRLLVTMMLPMPASTSPFSTADIRSSMFAYCRNSGIICSWMADASKRTTAKPFHLSAASGSANGGTS